MSQSFPDEFFPQRLPAQVKDQLLHGLAMVVYGLLLRLIMVGYHAQPGAHPPWLISTFGVGYLFGALGLCETIGVGMWWLWWRRRGLRVTSAGLSEVFRRDRQRLREWHEIEGVEEKAGEAGRIFAVKTPRAAVRFDATLVGWERLIPCIWVELAERGSVAAAVVDPTHQNGSATDPDLRDIAPWLEDLPRALRYSRSTFHRAVMGWVWIVLGCALCGVVARLNVGGMFLWLGFVFFSRFLGTTWVLCRVRRRVKNANVTISEEGISMVDADGKERRTVWGDMIDVQAVERAPNVGHGPSHWARRTLAARALQIRTPWGFFEIDGGLEEYDRLMQLLQNIVAMRPPGYHVAHLVNTQQTGRTDTV